MKNATCNELKGYKYIADSFALELKYFHANDSISKIKTIWSDYSKRDYLDSNSWLYVVALLESDDDDDYKKKKGLIEAMKDEMNNQCPDYNDRLFCHVLRKDKVDWSKFEKQGAKNQNNE